MLTGGVFFHVCPTYLSKADVAFKYSYGAVSIQGRGYAVKSPNSLLTLVNNMFS